MIKCLGCGIEIMFGTDNLCGVCRADEQMRAIAVDKIKRELFEKTNPKLKPTLEVFVVRMCKDDYVKMIVILAIDETDAVELAQDEHQSDGWVDYSLSQSVQGPFKRGSVLYFNTSKEGKRVNF